jgi:hypothetical protein
MAKELVLQLMLGADSPDAVTCPFFSQLLPISPFQVFDLAGFLLFFISLTFAWTALSSFQSTGMPFFA